ncbi:MAG: mechanosensitive ion channel family protein [Spirochaetia bacterium]
MIEKIMQFIPLTPAQIAYLSNKGAIVFVIFALTYLIVHLFKRAILGNKKKALALDRAWVPIVMGIVSGLAYSIALFTSLDILGIISKTTILTVLGSLGLGVGFALKDLLSNTIAGIIILIARPFSAGDLIDCNSGNQRVSGIVQLVSILTTKLESVDGVCIFIPNQLVWASPIINYSHNPTRRVTCALQISHAAPIEEAIQTLYAVIAQESRFLQDPAPMVIVSAIEDEYVKVELRAWTHTADYTDTLFDVTKNVKKAYESALLTEPVHTHHIQLSSKDFLRIKNNEQ